MTINPLLAKVAAPYASALYNFSVNQNLMHQITADLQNLEIFLIQTPQLKKYLENPSICPEQKQELLEKTLQPHLNKETFKFLIVLIKRNRINLLESITNDYLNLVYKLASIKMIEISTAFTFNNLQTNTLIKKLKKLTNSREIHLIINVDSTLIGGFLIKMNSTVIDFTLKNQLQLLAKHLDSVLEI